MNRGKLRLKIVVSNEANMCREAPDGTAYKHWHECAEFRYLTHVC